MVNGIVTSNGIGDGGKDPKSDLLYAVNSRETPAQKVRAIAVRARIHGYPGLTEAVLAQLNEHNQDVQCLTGDCDRSLQQLVEAVNSSTNSDDFSQLFSAAEEVRTDVPILAQQAVRLCTRAIEISQAMLADLKRRPDELDAEAEKIVTKIKSQLTKIGSGVEAQVAWRHGQPASAERQFEFQARHGNVHSQAAFAAASEARSVNSAIQQSIGSYTTLLNEARKMLVGVAKKAIAG